ncbi:Plasmodium variant antigen protein Cir/Yir/Bir, putative, partial [Plasmodium berghei]
MAISKVCGEFETIWKFFPDELKDSGEYDFKNALLNAYCPNGDSENNKECKTDVDKINAGSLWLFNKFYGDSNKFSNYADGKIDVVVYFMMWLGYKLNQKTHDGINTFNDFYTRNINNNEKYTNTIDGCGEFETIWKFFPDELKDSGEYDFKNALLNAYCPNGDSENNKECKTDVDKINAGSLWLFNKFYGDSNKFSNYADGKIDVVVYFMMWLGYKLNQKTHDGINTFNDFYTRNINNNEKYTNTIDGVEGYNSYKDLIDKKKE